MDIFIVSSMVLRTFVKQILNPEILKEEVSSILIVVFLR